MASASLSNDTCLNSILCFLLSSILLSTALTFVIIILICINVEMAATHSRMQDCDPMYRDGAEPLTDSIHLMGMPYQGRPPLANLNVTKEEVNRFLGLNESVLLSDLLSQVAQCRMAVNLQWNTSDGHRDDKKICNRIDGAWLAWGLTICVLSNSLKMWYWPSDITKKTKRTRMIVMMVFAIISAMAWLCLVAFYLKRPIHAGLWYLEYGTIRQVAYYIEPTRWTVIYGFGITNLCLGIIDMIVIVIASFCVNNEKGDKSSSSGSRKRRSKREEIDGESGAKTVSDRKSVKIESSSKSDRKGETMV